MEQLVPVEGRATATVRQRPAARPPWLLLGLSVLIAAAMLLPLLYLLMRAGNLGAAVWPLVTRPRTLQVLWHSIALATSVTLAATLLGIPLAWLTTRTDLPGRRLWLLLTALPLGIPSFVGGYIMVAAFGPRGMLQQLLEPLGVQRLPEIYGFPGALLALTLFSYPYVMLSVRASLRGLDPALEESARSLGHNNWTIFWRLTLPLLRPSIAAGALLVSLYVLSDFGAVSLLQFDSFTRAIYVQYSASLNRNGAAVLALMLMLLTLAVLTLESWSQGRGRYHRSTGGAVRPLARIALGPWRWPALLFCGSIVLIALVVPLGVLLFWLFRGLAAGEPLQLVWRATFNSVLASSLAAIVTTAGALPLAFLVVRYPSPLSRLVERTAYVGYALPGIVIALSLVFFGARYLPLLYQTLAMLIFAYAVRFLPEAVGALRSALLQVSPRVEEAARSLGRSPWQVVWSITLPLIRPGLTSAAALVFLTTMKELPSTLLLGPTGFDTLATRIWSATAEGFFARAAAPALLLVFVSAFSLIPLLRETRRE
jgi:iron(III) transport system permease protein